MKIKITEIKENRKNPINFFENRKQIKEGVKPQIKIFVNKEGKLIPVKGEIIEVLKKHFETLLNRQGQNIIVEDLTFQIAEPNIEGPKLKEVARIIEELKNNKSPSENKIQQSCY